MRFEGALQAFGQSLVADDDPRPVYALLDLLQPEKLDQMLMQTYGPELMPRHLPVLVSQWSKYYFMHLIPLVVVAVLVQGWCWPLALEGIGVSLDSRGLPDGVKLPEQGAAVAVESFDGLLDHNLQPVIESLSAYSGVGGGVLGQCRGLSGNLPAEIGRRQRRATGCRLCAAAQQAAQRRPPQPPVQRHHLPRPTPPAP